MDTNELIGQSRIPLRYREAWKMEQKDGPWRKAGIEVFGRLGRGGLFVFCGKSGVGKTQLGANIIYNAIRSHKWTCLYSTTRDFFLAIKSAYHKGSETTEESVIASYAKPALLVLDEFDKRGESQWEDGLLEHLINKRYGAMKDTILIANLKEQEMVSMLGPANVSRMNETGMIIVCEWDSFREGEGQCG